MVISKHEVVEGGWLTRMCRTVFGHGRFAPLRTRSGRRWLSIAYLAVTFAFPLVGYAVGEVWAVLAVLLAFAVTSILMTGATGAMFDKPLSRLDERERHVRQTVFANPYFVGGAVGLAGGLIVAWALNQPEPVTAGWFLGVNAFVFGLPSVVVCWTLPDEVDDED